MHVEKPGLIVAPLTPFTADLDVDAGALRREIDYVVRDCRATMVVAAGVETQEYTYLSLEQRKALIRHTIACVDGRVPVMVGISHPSFRTAIELAHFAESLGAAAVQLLAPLRPFAGPPTHAGLLAYFEAVARESKLPIALYLNPGPGADVSIADTVALAKLPRVELIKESSRDLARVSRLIVEIDRAGHARYFTTMQMLLATLELGGLAVLIVILISLPVGVYSAVRRGSALDYAARAFAALGQAVPPFWLGLVLVLIFGVMLHLLPTSGRGTPLHVLLPGITLGWFAVAGLMRLTRSSMLDVLGSEYVKLARIKGLPERRVIWRHAFKNAALPVVTFAALLFVALLNGSIIVETVFGWPGLGLLVIEAVDSRDYPIVQTVVLCLSAMYIGVNLLVDVLYAYLNPKIRYSR